jgi:tetratricopeptide (TPR) repeat protein
VLACALPASAERDAIGVEACSQALSSGARTGMSREEAESLLEEGRLFAGANPRARGVLQIRFGSFQIHGLADWRSLGGALRALIREATEAGDVVLRLAAQAQILVVFTTVGPASQALELCDDTLAAPPDQVAEALRLADTTLAAVVGIRSGLLGLAGRLREQRIESERAVALAAAASDRGFARHSVLSWRATALLRVGDAAAAAAVAREAMALSDAMGAPALTVWPRVWFGQSYLYLGRAAEALVELEEALRVVRATGAVRQAEPSLWHRVADAHRQLGDVGRAENAAREGVRVSRLAGGLDPEVLARIALARALVAKGGGAFAADAERELAVCEELIRETEFVGNLPPVHLARAELARALGDEAGCERELREALRLYTEMGADGHAERLARDLAS